MDIRFIEQQDIDYSRWDRCISGSLNGEVYGYSWYIDTLTDRWGALVEGDYNAVMPLVYNSKILFREIITHPLLKHTGIYSGSPVDAEKIRQFINFLPSFFRKTHICFNRQNTQAVGISDGKNEVSVFELDLILPYEKIRKTYSPSIISSLKEAEIKKMTVLKHPSLTEILKFLQTSSADISKRIFLDPLQKILSHLLSKSKAEILGVYGPENSLYAMACFVRSNSNVSLFYAHTLPEKVDSGINYLLLDAFLKSYSGRNITLSLEHIDTSWDDNFYHSFGALPSYKFNLIQNNLPFFLKWLF